LRFASFLSGGFTHMAVINLPERKLAKRTSVQYSDWLKEVLVVKTSSYMFTWVQGKDLKWPKLKRT
jgi:hypothetical protein